MEAQIKQQIGAYASLEAILLDIALDDDDDDDPNDQAGEMVEVEGSESHVGLPHDEPGVG